MGRFVFHAYTMRNKKSNSWDILIHAYSGRYKSLIEIDFFGLLSYIECTNVHCLRCILEHNEKVSKWSFRKKIKAKEFDDCTRSG